MIPPQDPAFEQMINTARILIIDHDINRYHSFELYSYLLTQREYFFNPVDKKFLVDFVKQSTLNKKLMYYLSLSEYLNPFQHFTITSDKSIEWYEDKLNELFPIIHTIPTDISYRLSPMLYNKTIEGFLLKYKNDTHISGYENQVKVFKTDHILDGAFAVEIIRSLNISAIFISSIDIALMIAMKLYEINYKSPIMFYVGIYRYNYDPETKTMKHTSAITTLEYIAKHSFMTIDPFTNLSYDKDSQYDNFEKEVEEN
jgi:hypothetical protein